MTKFEFEAATGLKIDSNKWEEVKQLEQFEDCTTKEFIDLFKDEYYKNRVMWFIGRITRFQASIQYLEKAKYDMMCERDAYMKAYHNTSTELEKEKATSKLWYDMLREEEQRHAEKDYIE